MSELAELAGKVRRVSDLYAARLDIRRDDDWYVLKLQEELGELVAAYLSASQRGRDRGLSPGEIGRQVASEAADLFAHLLLFIDHNDIDLEAALERKWFSRLDQTPQKTKTE